MLRFAIILCALAVAACASLERGEVPITGYAWRVFWLKGWGVAEYSGLEGTEAAYFRLVDGRVEGSGGCNRIAGEYSQTGGQIEFMPMVSTRRACIVGMEREDAFLQALENVRLWQRRGDRLRLYDASGRMLMEMKAVLEKSAQPARN
ncbi:MAG: META domain-containing protein [Betaproteobacteria bacterium]|nr:META domain-containing protein [Betaproteobacteria bacterium]